MMPISPFEVEREREGKRGKEREREREREIEKEREREREREKEREREIVGRGVCVRCKGGRHSSERPFMNSQTTKGRWE
jgi:hypothetical protein